MSGAEDICREHIESLPDTPCGTFLETGAGSGLGALCDSRAAGYVWATDITSRAAGYAEFNRRLNLVSNMTVLQGDLFAPVEELKFDRIACNPPFEPPLKRGHVFSAGGEDGEQIMRRVLQGAPAHLNPGGRLYMQMMGANREGDDLDARIRRYLGKSAEECDIALFIRQRMEPREYAIDQILAENEHSWKLDEWIEFYKKLRALEVLQCHLIVQRAAEPRLVFHIVRSFGPRTSLPPGGMAAGLGDAIHRSHTRRVAFRKPPYGRFRLSPRRATRHSRRQADARILHPRDASSVRGRAYCRTLDRRHGLVLRRQAYGGGATGLGAIQRSAAR